MTLVLLLAAVIVVADQVSKTAALAHLVPGHPVVLADGWLSLTLVMNPGLAFGLLGTLEPAWRWLVAALSIVALLVLARVALRVLPTGGLAGVIAIGLIFGGACTGTAGTGRRSTWRTRRSASAWRCWRFACSQSGRRRPSDVRTISPLASSVERPRLALPRGGLRDQRRRGAVGVPAPHRAPGDVGVMRGSLQHAP